MAKKKKDYSAMSGAWWSMKEAMYDTGQMLKSIRKQADEIAAKEDSYKYRDMGQYIADLPKKKKKKKKY